MIRITFNRDAGILDSGAFAVRRRLLCPLQGSVHFLNEIFVQKRF